MTGNVNAAINQIADKLGTTTDRVLSVLPSYARMSAFDGVIWAIIGIVVGVVLLVVAYKIWRRYPKGDIDSDLFGLCGLCCLALFIISVIAIWCGIASAISAYKWATWPDAMMAREVLDALRSN